VAIMGEQRTPLDILDTILKIPHSLLKRIRVRKRIKREIQRTQMDLIPIIEQLIENEASMETIKQGKGKTPKRAAIKTLKKSKKKKTYPNINLAAKTPNNSVNKNPKIKNEKLLQHLLKTGQKKPLMKTEDLIIPAKKATENKSSIEKNKTSNQKNVQSQSTTNTKPSKKGRPKALLKKSVQKNSNLILFNPLNGVQDTDEYINSIIDDL
jgi:hypothetical protein